MTQEQESYIKYVEKDAPTSLHDYVFGFQRAWRERIDSVWHKKEEVPADGKYILCIQIDGTPIIFGKRYRNWEKTVKDFWIIRWAYVKDLMPTEE